MSGTPLADQDDVTGTASAGRVADVLLLFATAPLPLGVSAIGRQLGLSKAVVHRILRSLASRQLVTADASRRGYRLGPAAVALGARALRDSSLRAVASPVLRRLRDQTGETTTLSGLAGDERVYLDQFPSQREITMVVQLGERFPLHAGASSRAILAFLAPQRRAALLDRPLAALTPATPTDRELVEAGLADVVRDGVAVSFGERQDGAASIAAPVFDVDGVAGAISACGPVHRFDAAVCRRLGPLVRGAADEISAALGASAPPDRARAEAAR